MAPSRGRFITPLSFPVMSLIARCQLQETSSERVFFLWIFVSVFTTPGHSCLSGHTDRSAIPGVNHQLTYSPQLLQKLLDSAESSCYSNFYSYNAWNVKSETSHSCTQYWHLSNHVWFSTHKSRAAAAVLHLSGQGSAMFAVPDLHSKHD